MNMNKKKKAVLHVSAGGLNKGGVGSVIFSLVEKVSLCPNEDICSDSLLMS